MIKEAVATGVTVEEAFASACRELGVETTDAECEILQLPAKKILGLFGGNPAKVRAYIEVKEPEVRKAPAKSEPAKSRERRPQTERKPEKKIEKREEKKKEIREVKEVKEVKAAPVSADVSGDAADAAAVYLKGLLRHMGFEGAEVSVRREEGGALLYIENAEARFIIGHRGETLDSLQYLTSLVANHHEKEYYRITLDVGDYREKRKGTLEILGRKTAVRAVRTGRNCALEPMNPYERRIIHTAVQTVAGARSWSEGSDMNRHVVVGPEGGERYMRRGGDRGRYNNRSRDSRGDRSRGAARPSAPAGERPAPRQDDPVAPVYGKIEKN